MSTPSDLTQTAEALIYALVNAANAGLAGNPASASNITLGTPTVISAGGDNTSLTLTAIPGHGYTGVDTVTYNRLDIAAVFTALGVTPTLNGGSGYLNASDLLAPLKTAYGLNLQASDIVDGAIGAGAYPFSYNLVMAAGSLAYTGSVAVTLQNAAASLAAHPRLMMDTPTVTRMASDVTSSAPEYTALKSLVDTYLNGVVNYPDQEQYPNIPDIGSGYQGESYIIYLVSTCLVYLALKQSDPTAALPYGQKGVAILMAMSQTSGVHQWPPATDDGYGIRNYGVSFGLGYDWLYDLLTPTQRTQVWTCANQWITYWESGATFEFNGGEAGSCSNYFAGYVHGKTAIALATYDENPNAPGYYTDLMNVTLGSKVLPYFNAHMVGGGWPEGFGNYGSLATTNMSMPVWQLDTATNGATDLVTSGPFTFPIDQARFLMHFTWPSLVTIDNRDTTHSTGKAVPAPCTSNPDLITQVGLMADRYDTANAPVFRSWQAAVTTALQAQSTYSPTEWYQFLFKPVNTTTADYTAQPLSYLAEGMNMVAARSSWATDASWMSIRSAPYIDFQDSGEEGFGQGALAITNGALPLLVNAEGWLMREPGGNADENLLEADLTGPLTGSVFSGNRQCYNIYYVRHMTDPTTVAERYGQASYNFESEGITTKIAAYEDNAGHVYTRCTGLEQAYFVFTAGAAVSAWTREILYLRPHRFVVFDQTTMGDSSYDNLMAWHFPANPTANTVAAGQSQYGVTFDGTYLGSVTTVLPESPVEDVVALYPTSSTPKVWQLQVHSPNTNVSNQWMTVFDTAAVPSVLANLPGTHCAAVSLTGTDGNEVAVFAQTEAFSYAQPQDARTHTVAGLVAGHAYDVTFDGNLVSVAVGTTYTASAAGVIRFALTAVAFGLAGTFGTATQNTEYTATLQIVGPYVGPVTITGQPAWLGTPTVSGQNVTFTGTAPNTVAVTNFTLTITDSTAGTAQTATFDTSISVAAPVPMSYSGTLPTTGQATQAYTGTLTVGGSFVAPLTPGVASGTMPSWMTATVSGNTVTYSGTPSQGAATVTFVPSITDASTVPQVADAPSQSVTIASIPSAYWSPTNINANQVLSAGVAANSTITFQTGGTGAGMATLAKNFTGPVYFEALLTVAASPTLGAGIGWTTSPVGFPDNSDYAGGGPSTQSVVYAPGGMLENGYGVYAQTLAPVAPGVYRFGILIDPTTLNWWITDDGSTWLKDNSGNPGNPADPATTLTKPIAGTGVYTIVGSSIVAGNSVEVLTDPVNMIWTSIVPEGYTIGIF